MAGSTEPSTLRSRLEEKAKAGDEDAQRIVDAVIARDEAEAAALGAAAPVDAKRAKATVEDKMAGAGV